MSITACLESKVSLGFTAGGGYKATKAYSVLPTSGAGDLVVARASASVRINEGVLVSVADDVPVEDSVAGVKSIAVLPQAANLIADFIDLSAASWARSNMDILAGQADMAGGTNAYKLTATADAATWKLAAPKVVVNTTVYSNLICIKRVTGTGVVSLIDVNNGDVVKTITSEWTIISDRKAATSTDGQLGIKLATSGDEVLIYNANLTTTDIDRPISVLAAGDGMNITRQPDSISKTGIAALIGQTEGTVVVDVDIRTLAYDTAFVIIYNPAATGGVTGRITIEKTSANQLLCRIQTASTVQFGTTPITAGRYKIGIAYKANDCVFTFNGVERGTSTSVAIPTDMSVIHLGSFQGGFAPCNDNIRLCYLSKTRVTNAELITLTTL